MIEIVFGKNAYNSLIVVQSYGKGKYHGGAVSVFIRNTDGTEPTAEEIQAAQLQAEENARQEWENAIPLNGKREDIYCFDIALSVGDISDNGLGEQRKAVLRNMLFVCPVEDLEYQIEEIVQKANSALSSVLKLRTPDFTKKFRIFRIMRVLKTQIFTHDNL